MDNVGVIKLEKRENPDRNPKNLEIVPTAVSLETPRLELCIPIENDERSLCSNVEAAFLISLYFKQ